MKTATVKVKRSDIRKVMREDGDADTSYLEQEGFEDHLAKYHAGDFSYVGVWAEVGLVVNGVIQVIRSGGLWGIEHDGSANSDQYIDGVFAEESEALVEILTAMGIEVE
jgi:hypothetical protein